MGLGQQKKVELEQRQPQDRSFLSLIRGTLPSAGAAAEGDHLEPKEHPELASPLQAEALHKGSRPHQPQ